jgi:uncharacterized protein YjbI with pentapeptide repeats
LPLLEVSFSESDLSNASFNHCDLQGSKFDQCNLEKTDFSAALHYSIDPERNRLKKTRFSLNGITGLLDKHDIVIE